MKKPTLMTRRRTATRTDPSPALRAGNAKGSSRSHGPNSPVSRSGLPTPGRTHLLLVRVQAQC